MNPVARVPSDALARFEAQVAILRAMDDVEFAAVDPAALQPISVPVRVRFIRL